MIIKITKIINPITALPPTTKLPKDKITSPAYPSNKINRVEETFSANRNNVVINNSEGNTEKSNGSTLYTATITITKAMVIFKHNNKSNKIVGSGIIIIITIVIIARAIIMSLYFFKNPIVDSDV